MRLIRKIAILIIPVSFCCFEMNAQLVNQGILYVGKETTLSVRSDMANNTGGILHNEGTIVVKGDMVNNSTYNGNGAVIMANHSTHTSLKMGGDTIYKLVLSESEYTQLTHDVYVADSIVFTGGDLLLAGHTLKLPDTIGFKNHSATRHITTNSGKIVMVNFDNATGIELPISYGTDLGYTPLTIANTGAADHFTIQMTDSVTDNAQRSGNITPSNDRVEAMWMMDDSLNTAYNLNLTLKWQADEEGSSFNTANCGIATYENGKWNLNPGDLANSPNRSLSKTGITNIEDIAFAIGDGESDLISGLTFALKVFLRGPYNTTNDNMDNSINGIIPTTAASTSVYGGAPYSYTGSESFVTAPATAVDWVLVELRDAASPAAATSSTAVDTVASLLMQDGTIKAADGISNIAFEGVSINNNPYVVIRHRNHLDIMSSTAVTQSGGLYTYDFTTAATQAYGTKAQTLLETGVYGMFAGDVNGDGSIVFNGINSDRELVLIQVGANSPTSPQQGYSAEDTNMDGSIVFNGINSDRELVLIQVGANSPTSPRHGQVP